MKIKAPWNDEQVAALNRFQNYGFVHPFTCPVHHHGDRTLVATTRGWVCPGPSCDYHQDWAHDYMLKEFKNPIP